MKILNPVHVTNSGCELVLNKSLHMLLLKEETVLIFISGFLKEESFCNVGYQAFVTPDTTHT